MKQQLVGALLLLTAFLSASVAVAQREEYDPWQVPPERFYNGVKVIAVTPLTVPRALEGEVELRQRIEALLVDRLQARGFEVVPVLECEATWETICNRLGGLDDPETGDRDPEKFSAARKHFLNELQARYGADAVLHAAIIGAPAFVGGGKRAHWCGVSQRIEDLPGSLRRRPPEPPTGTCLAVIVEEVLGIDMYINIHGLEIVVRPVAGQWELIPPEELFTDVERLQAALDVTLGPLLENAEE